MNGVKVFDWPTRIFHWFFAGIFVIAFFITKTIDDESPVFAYHMLLGFILTSIVVLRILWGFFGSRYARFSSFVLNPFDLIRYFKEVLGAKPVMDLGHNPATSWAALLMMGLALGLGLTGYLMTGGGSKETLEDGHELLANAFAITAILHVAGVFFHTFRQRDAIALSMVHGRKAPVDGHFGIEKTYPVFGFLFLLMVGAFSVYLYNHYDKSTQVLNLFGKTLQFGETENEGEGEKEKGEDEEDD